MNEHEEESLRRLLEDAGPRPPIPQEDLDAIAGAARFAWRRHRRHRRQLRRQPRRSLWIGLAAALAVTVGLAVWWSLQKDEAYTASAWIEAATNPIHLNLPDGVTARLDAKSRLRALSPTVLELERGAVYVDTGEGPQKAIEIRTSVGTVRDIGTRFAVRIVEPERSALLVRVRDGAVLTEQNGRIYRTQAGQELTLRSDGTWERHEAAPYGPEWAWVLAATPGFEIEGRTLREFLHWVSRETGWRIVLADAGLEDSASQTVLHGSIGKLPPDQAPFAVLPGAGLEGEVENGALIVRRR